MIQFVTMERQACLFSLFQCVSTMEPNQIEIRAKCSVSHIDHLTDRFIMNADGIGILNQQ